MKKPILSSITSTFHHQQQQRTHNNNTIDGNQSLSQQQKLQPSVQYKFQERIAKSEHTHVYRAIRICPTSVVASTTFTINDDEEEEQGRQTEFILGNNNSNHSSNQTTVIIKVHANEFPSSRIRNRFKREFKIGTTITSSTLIRHTSQQEQTLIYSVTSPTPTSTNSATSVMSAFSDMSVGNADFRQYCEHTFHSKNIISYYDIYKHGHGLAIVMEDFGGQGLWQSIPKCGVSLPDFLTIALQLIEAIGVIHQNGFIHNSISPYNIVINWETRQVKLGDFGCSTQLNQEAHVISLFRNIQNIGREMWYLSPEQTGRTNRAVTYTSDFYSLGVVLYELLCGSVPFAECEDAMEVVYSIIAKVPPSPRQVRHDIPTVISDIVMNLMAKNPDDRYQSAYGVKMDLLACQALFDSMGNSFNSDELSDSVELRKYDLHSTFHLKEKLYGREKQVNQLIESYTYISEDKIRAQLLLVSGYSGIGKTSLINEIQKPMTKPPSGYFITGKFDQVKRKMMIPYASFIEAFQQLILLILSESREKIHYWKTQLNDALGTRGRIIIDVIPEVECIIGPQPAVPILAPTENQNRFNQVLRDFIHVFARKDHPLVISLDDLQWADVSSLKLIETLILDVETKYLQIIGTYRSNECNEAHPLMSLIRTLATAKQETGENIVDEIVLSELQPDDLTAFITDSLYIQDHARARKLAEIIYQKTGGNPFFLISYLTNLVHEKLIYYDYTLGEWMWDVEQIIRTRITENVVDLMTKRIKKLPRETQELLSLAAAIGDKFDLETLSILSSHSSREVIVKTLWPAIKDGLILQKSGEDCENLTHGAEVCYDGKDEEATTPPSSPVSIVFLWMHDRVQQAAYELLDAEEGHVTHLTIGRILLQQMGKEEWDDSYEIISHFKIAQPLITDKKERLTIARLNLEAGKRAKMSAAYQSAANYFSFAIKLLPENSWETEYELTFQLYMERAQIHYLRSKFDKAEQLYPLLLAKAKDEFDKYAVHMVMITQYEIQQRYQDAIDLILYCLDMFGMRLPRETEALEELLNQELEDIHLNLANRSIESLIDADEIVDPKDLAIMRLLHTMWTPSYASGFVAMTAVSSVRSANYSLQHGNCDVSSIGYMNYSFMVGEKTDDYVSAWRFGKLAIQLAEKYDNIPIRCKCFFVFGCGTNTWVERISSSLHYLNRCFELALEIGDISYSCYSSNHYATDIFYANEHFSKVKKVYEEKVIYLKRTNPFILTFVQCSMNPFRYLTNTEDDPLLRFDEESFLQTDLSKAELFNAIYKFGRLQKAVYKGERDIWLDLAEEVYERTPPLLPGTIKICLSYFYASLVFLAECSPRGPIYFDNSTSGMRIDNKKFDQLMRKVEVAIDKFTIWASSCKSNFQHKLLILKAERARVLGHFQEAVQFYSDAISSAREYDFVLYEALANELAAKFWFSSGISMYATQHLKNAHYLYHRIGACAKVLQLQALFPDLDQQNSSKKMDEEVTPQGIQLRNFSLESDEDENSETSDGTATESGLDNLTVYKGLQALISSDMKLEEFLNRMMKIIIESAGAQRAVFILVEQQNRLLVVAEGFPGKQIDTILAIPIECYPHCPKMIIYAVENSKETVILNDCNLSHQFSGDSYMSSTNLKSLMCIPIIKQDHLKGILYLENNLITNAFSQQRCKIVAPLAAQVAVSLENAKFSSILESEKKYKTLAVELESRKKRLEEFIDVLCHELRNPLHGIVGNTEMLNDVLPQIMSPSEQSEDDSTIPSAKDFIEAITISAHHLKDIVDSVLNISMLESQSIKLQSIVFDPCEAVRMTLHIFKSQLLNKNVSLESRDVDDHETLVTGDPYRFKEIIINLISNAIKFTPRGSISLSCSCIPVENTNKINVVVCVQDTGIGMTPREQNRLFKPFSQASSDTYDKYGGSGLGLKISKDLVELMGGTIGLESEKDKGTKFYFNILLEKPSTSALEEYMLIRQEQKMKNMVNNQSSDQSQRQHANDDNKKNHQTDAKVVLVAEDNSINQKLLTRLLQMEGYQYKLANNGLEAFNIFCSCPIDIILMDIEMPVCSGPESARKIRAFEREHGRKRVPIVGVSANARTDYINKAIKQNEMDDYITKPYMKKDIYAMIERWTRNDNVDNTNINGNDGVPECPAS